MKFSKHIRLGPLMTGILLASLGHSHAVVIDHFDTPVGGQSISITNGIVGTSTSSI